MYTYNLRHMFKPKSYRLSHAPSRAAIQGQPGSFSEWTLSNIFGDAAAPVCCETFEQAMDAVAKQTAEAAVIPIANSIAGPVPYVPGLIRSKKLEIVGEYFLPVEMCLLGLPGTPLRDIDNVHSHMHALAQCRAFLNRRSYLQQHVFHDTGAAAKMVAEKGDPRHASISPARAAHLYGLEIKRRGIQDAQNNITRFIVLTRADQAAAYETHDPSRTYITALIIKPLRRIEWPLADTLKILKDHRVKHSHPWEYTGSNFRTDGLYIELVGHPSDRNVGRAIDALKLNKKGTHGITSDMQVIGVFPAHHVNRFGRSLSGPA
jgi:prephenate dehydratase